MKRSSRDDLPPVGDTSSPAGGQANQADQIPAGAPAPTGSPTGRPAAISAPIGRARATAAPARQTAAPMRQTAAPRATQAPSSQPSAGRARATAAPALATGAPPAGGPRPTMAPVSGGRAAGGEGRHSVGEEVRFALEAAVAREHQRRRLIHILAFAQILLTLAAIPGYVSPQPVTPVLAALGAALVVNTLAFLASRMFNNVTAGAYLLVFGGGLVVAAHVLVAALAGDAPGAAQASLFFLVTILEASLLFSPEVTLITAVVPTVLTGGALFLAFAQGKAIPNGEAYLLVVYSMSIQAVTGVIAWLVAQFLFESGAAAQRAQHLRLAAAQLDATREHSAQQQQRLEDGIVALQGAITRVLGGERAARVDVVPGELADLMRSFNLLLERVQSLVEHERGQAGSAESVRQMIELITAISEGSPYAPPGLNPRGDTALGGVMQALIHLQARTARKGVKLQELATDVAGAVQTGLEGLGNTTDDIAQASQLAGVLIGIVDVLLPDVRSSYLLVTQAREAIGRLLPPEVLQAATEEAMHRDAGGLSPEQAAHLLGHGTDLEGLPDIFEGGLTGDYTALPPEPAGGAPAAAIPPLTVPLAPLSDDPAKAARQVAEAAKGAGAAEGDAQARLLELWRMLVALSARLAKEHSTLRRLSRELGKLARAVRSADAGVVHGEASLEAARLKVRQLQQVLGGGTAPGYSDDYPPAVPPPMPPMAARAPTSAPPYGGGVGPATSGFEYPAPDLPSLDSFPSDGGYLDASALIDPHLRDTPGDAPDDAPRGREGE